MELLETPADLELLEPRGRANTLFSTKSSLLHQSGHSLHSSVHASLAFVNGEEVAASHDDCAEDPPIGVDRGRAWFSVVGAFISTALIGGIEMSFGIQSIFLEESYDATALEVSWMGSLCTMLRFLCGTIAALLCVRYGCAMVSLIGSLFYALGFSLSTFMPHVELLYFTYGILPGIGSSLIYISSSLLVNDRFDRLRGRANGIYLAGSGVGLFSMPIIIQYLHSSYGLHGELLILGGISMHMFVASAFLFMSTPKSRKGKVVNIPVDAIETQSDLKRVKSTNEVEAKFGKRTTCGRLMRKFFGCTDVEGSENVSLRGFVLLITSIGFSYMGFMAAIFALPSLARARGISSSKAALLISIVGASDIMGRTLSGLLFDKFVSWRKHMYTGGYIILGFSIISMPLMSHFNQFVAVAMFFGFFGGVIIAMRPVVCVEAVGKEAFKHYFGFLVTAQGIGVLIGPPIASGLQSVFADHVSFYFCAGVEMVAALLLSIDIILDRVVARQKQVQ